MRRKTYLATLRALQSGAGAGHVGQTRRTLLNGQLGRRRLLLLRVGDLHGCAAAETDLIERPSRPLVRDPTAGRLPMIPPHALKFRQSGTLGGCSEVRFVRLREHAPRQQLSCLRYVVGEPPHLDIDIISIDGVEGRPEIEQRTSQWPRKDAIHVEERVPQSMPPCAFLCSQGAGYGLRWIYRECKLLAAGLVDFLKSFHRE